MRNSEIDNLNITFFGTSEFAAIVLEKLINSNYKPALVITQPDKPVGRKQVFTPPPVKMLAQKYNLSFIQPERLNSKDTLYAIQNTLYDLGIVAAYGQIIPKEILEIPRYGTLNVHPSLLPLWRGPSPIQYAILNGDEETGVTTMLMDEEVDHGAILSNAQCSMTNDQFKAEELSRKLADMGADLLINTIPDWIRGKIKPVEQDHVKATYSKKIEKDDGRIDWSKSANEIERQIRAFTPWPGSFTFLKNKRLKIISGRVYNSSTRPKKNELGKVLADGTGIIVQTGLGVFLIDRLQMEGKNQVSAKEFLNGHPDFIGAKLIS